MDEIDFELRGEHIALDALLKATGAAPSGGAAKALVAVQQHAASFIAHTEASTGAELPRFNEADSGAVTLIQRFGSAANLNIHLHGLLLDGVYRRGADGVPQFVEVGSPTDDEVHELLQIIIARLMKMLTRRGVLVEDMGQTYLAEPDTDGEEARTLRPLQAAAVTYRIAFGPRAGQKVLTLRGATPRESAARQPLCADLDGFSLHAAVRVAHDRQAAATAVPPHHPVGAVRRAGAAQRRRTGAAQAQDAVARRNHALGTTHLVMSPLEFMQRLAALVPRPRLHLIRLVSA